MFSLLVIDTLLTNEATTDRVHCPLRCCFRDYLQAGMAGPDLEEYITVTKKNHVSKNDGGKIIEKSFFEVKGMFLEKLARDTFSGIKGEDVVEHIEKFLKIIRPINIKNVITTWVELTDKLFDKFYPPSRTRVEKVNEVEISGAPVDYRFENFVAANFERYMTMDHYTMNSLWKFWNKNYGNEELSEEYKNDWICEWNDKIPWISEKPWKLDGIWKEPVPVKHRLEPFNYKNGCSEWPTYSWRDDGYCNGGNLPGQYVVGNQIHYQDLDHTIKEEGKDDQGKNKIIGEQDDQLVCGDEKCERSKVLRSGQETRRIRLDDNQRKCMSRIPRHLIQDGRGMVHDKGGVKMLLKKHGYGVSAPYHTAYRMPGRYQSFFLCFNMAYYGLPDMAYRLPVAV
ncbi:hypothetical protein Tco_0838839 [Tanacetum coccineum]|uniref:Uncharacterized protein n=1 Tax=Tanacetum coccineum TaxID=301880 RepID=A0ABQ5AS53_9ASTR